MSAVCFAFFLLLGFVGWRASLMFVRHIYRVGPQLLSSAHSCIHVTLDWSCCCPPCRPSSVSNETQSNHFLVKSENNTTAHIQIEGARCCCRSEQGPCTDV